MTDWLVSPRRPAAPGIVVNVGALLCALAIHLAPWHRWSPSSSTVIPPIAFGLVALGQRVAPGAPSVYGVWFVVVFAWIGFWHPPRTALRFAPLGAVAYVAPFVGVATAPAGMASSVTIAIPAAVVLAEVIASKMSAIRLTEHELVQARTLLEIANLTDDLTGVGNRRRANILLDSMKPGDGLVLLDLDHFKTVNDTHGHAEGDRVLAALGDHLRRSVREADTVARFGGEEFLVLLRGGGWQIGEASARLVAGWREQALGVTLSAGGAVHTADRGPDATFCAADAAMYAAKATGRDRIVLESAPSLSDRHRR